MGSKLSRKELIKDNQEMLGTIKWCSRVIDEQLAANVQLTLNLSSLQKTYDDLASTSVSILEGRINEQLHTESTCEQTNTTLPDV